MMNGDRADQKEPVFVKNVVERAKQNRDKIKD